MKTKIGTTTKTPANAARAPKVSAKKALEIVKANDAAKGKKTTAPKPGRVTDSEIIALRTLKFKHPEMNARQLKEKTGIALNPITIDRTLRGLIHAGVDMCGLPVRPFGSPRVKTTKAA